jgi:hypothetical protein
VVTPQRRPAGLFPALFLFLVLLVSALPGQDSEQEPAVLDTRVSWGRGVPLFPANTARYFLGRYDLGGLPVDVYVIERDTPSGLPEPWDPGSDSEPSGGEWGSVVSCGSVDLVPFASGVDEQRVTMEVPVPDSPFRLVMKVDYSASPDAVCSFVDSFVELFEYFRMADAERGRQLTFSGGRIPEFPGVVELSQ